MKFKAVLVPFTVVEEDWEKYLERGMRDSKSKARVQFWVILTLECLLYIQVNMSRRYI